MQEGNVLEIAVERNDGITEAVTLSISAVDEFSEQGKILFLQFGKASFAGLKYRNRIGLDVAYSTCRLVRLPRRTTGRIRCPWSRQTGNQYVVVHH